jgi:hypothetical protein
MVICGRMGVLFHAFLALKVDGCTYVLAYNVLAEPKETHEGFVRQVMFFVYMFGGSASIAGDCISRRCEHT